MEAAARPYASPGCRSSLGHEVGRQAIGSEQGQVSVHMGTQAVAGYSC